MIVIEQCQITPANSEEEFTLPLVFLDLRCHAIPLSQNIHFFQFPNCSRSQFLETIVPHLQESLSLALAHFLPFAGNILHNTTLRQKKNLVVRYVPGDSVSFAVCESEADLHQLAANSPRVSEEFYDLAPVLPPAVHTVSSSSCSVSAFQVTLFPGQGFSIGSIISHVVVDFQTLTTFLRSWALISRKLMVQETSTISACLDEANCLPCYERANFVRMTTSQGLGSIYWDEVVSRSPSPVESLLLKPPGTDRVRSILVLKKEDIQKLKDVYNSRVSSFVAVCAFVWFCFVKSGETADDDEPEAIFFPARCQGRISEFQVPDNYFGNCLAPILVELKHGELKSKNGFVMAVEAIGKGIWERVHGGGKGKGILHGAEDWPKLKQYFRKRQLSVAGSPKFDIYDTDFGWGRPNKFEALCTDHGDRITLCSSRDFQGGLEIGVSKPQIQMEAFTTVINQVLEDFKMLQPRVVSRF